VFQHHDTREHHRHRIDFVHPLVFGCAAVCRFEERCLFTDIGAGGNSQPAYQSGTQVGKDIPVEVGADDNIELLRVFYQLHGHVIDNSVLEFDIGILAG